MDLTSAFLNALRDAAGPDVKIIELALPHSILLTHVSGTQLRVNAHALAPHIMGDPEKLVVEARGALAALTKMVEPAQPLGEQDVQALIVPVLRSCLAWSLGAVVILWLLSPLAADEPPLHRRKDFRGTWASDAHCRWSDIFMLVYDRKSVGLPERSSGEPSLDCRILSVSGKRPIWKLRLSCQTWDAPEKRGKRFELRQTLTMATNGFEMVVETEPYLGNPARREEARYCRGANDPPPPLICFDEKKGHSYPCEP